MGRKPNWHQGEYKPKNPDKYVGDKLPKFKSGWENRFMIFCDTHPSVISWAYEPIQIPYTHPLKKDAKGRKKQSIYVPDFLISYRDKHGNKHVEMIEIKPKSQTVLTEKSTLKERSDVAVNTAKWREAQKWCRHRDIKFRILTKEEIFVK